MKQLGKQPARFSFFLNPYQDARFTWCPRCRGRTRILKFPLVIHVDPKNPVVLNKTCRYCDVCDLLIVHRDELEQQLALLFTHRAPELVGNDYLVIGTMDRPVYELSRKKPLTILEMLDNLHDFKEVLQFKLVGEGSARNDAVSD
jgi:hypothetical protein